VSDWQDRIMSGIAERKRPTTSRPSRGGATFESEFKDTLQRTHLHMDLAFIRLIDRAAKKRDVNRSTYMRRAIAIQLAHDLGLNVYKVLWHSPAPGRHGRVQTDRGQRDRGDDIENWCPHPCCDGKHLTKN
jgi:hypothetical protein